MKTTIEINKQDHARLSVAKYKMKAKSISDTINALLNSIKGQDLEKFYDQFREKE